MRFLIKIRGHVIVGNTPPKHFETDGDFASIAIAVDFHLKEVQTELNRWTFSEQAISVCLFSSFSCEPIAEKDSAVTPIYDEGYVDHSSAPAEHPPSSRKSRRSRHV